MLLGVNVSVFVGDDVCVYVGVSVGVSVVVGVYVAVGVGVGVSVAVPGSPITFTGVLRCIVVPSPS